MWHTYYLIFWTMATKILMKSADFLMKPIKIVHHNIILLHKEPIRYMLCDGKHCQNIGRRLLVIIKSVKKKSIRMCSDILQSVTKFIKMYLDELSVNHNDFFISTWIYFDILIVHQNLSFKIQTERSIS